MFGVKEGLFVLGVLDFCFETVLKMIGITLFYIYSRANYSGDMGNSLTKQ